VRTGTTPTSMPFVRRLLLPLAMLVALPALAAGVGDRIAWSDVALIDGRVLRASELRGRTVVVEFWATWCPFCAAQNPHLQKLHAQHGGKGLVVLTFSIDKDVEPVRKYMAERNYTFPVAMAGPQSDAWFGRRKALPEVYVVDASGRIVFRELGEMFPEDIAALARFASK
jgi:thiol-disulfide isomerase/thioredoxin